MNRISTHILDTALGKPAANVTVQLDRLSDSAVWTKIASAHTDADGRCGQLLPSSETLVPGTYRLTFDTAGYHVVQRLEPFYPLVEVTFLVRAGETQFHVPLLLSPHGYTTYRGS